MPKNPHADFTPTLAGYSGISPFRFWCQTALPLTYDDSLSYYELLNKVVNYLNHTIEDLTNVENNTSELAEAYEKLQKYVNDYFDDIDIEAELRTVLDGMAEDGTLDALLDPLVENQLPGVVDEKIDSVVASQIDEAVAGQIDESVADQLPAIVEDNVPGEVSDWLTENVNPVGSAVVVDSSLSISGAAADAKATGDADDGLRESIKAIENLEQTDITDTVNFVRGKVWKGAVGSEATLGTNYSRCSNAVPIKLDKGVYVCNVGDGYRLSYRVLDSNNIVLSDSGWKLTTFTINVEDDSHFYAFTGGKVGDASLTLEEFLTNITIYYTSPIIMEVTTLVNDMKNKADARDQLATIVLNGNYWVEVDSSANTLTLPADTSIVHNSEPETRYNFANAQTIDLTVTPNTGSRKILFNTNDNTFSVVGYNVIIPSGYLLIACYQINGSKSLTISCRYKIDGRPYGIDLSEMADTRDVLATITPPQLTPYVDVVRTSDTTNITFYADTTIFHNSLSAKRYLISEAQTVSIPTNVSALQKIIYNTETGVISHVAYNANIPTKNILLATLRTNPPTLSITCPYRINGKLYNINTVSPEEQITFSANVKSVNHRGFNTIAPENTLPAFKLSRERGFHYVETDVRFTSDGVPVLLHDATINRTARNSDGTEIANTINIADITLEQARTYDFGIWKSAAYAGTKIPTLAEFMKLCRDIGLTPRVELNVLTIQNAETMFAIIDSYGMGRKVEYNCNSIPICQKFLELEPRATIVFGMSSYSATTVDAVGALKTNNNTIIINMTTNSVTEELIGKCKQYDIELEVWTVNTSGAILALDPFISGVTSDNLNAAVILYNNAMS